MHIHSKLPNVGTTIFTVMSALATEYDAVNLGQGFPDYEMSGELISLVNEAMKKGILGIILCSLGIIGLIFITFDFMGGGSSSRNVAGLFLSTIAGAILFFGGLRLVDNTRKIDDKAS